MLTNPALLILLALLLAPFSAALLVCLYCRYLHRLQADYFYRHWKAYVGTANLPPEPIRHSKMPRKKIFTKKTKGTKLEPEIDMFK